MAKRVTQLELNAERGPATAETALDGDLSLRSDVRPTLGPTLSKGAQLAAGRLQIVRTLGRGGTGILYQAKDAVRGCDVALKQLRYRGPEAQYSLKLEFRALQDVSHPNLVRLHELFADDHGCYFTMDLVVGVTFERWVRPEGRFDESRLRPALAQLLDAVTAIHDAGKLHRDLKPSNVLVTHAGQVVVLDFGLVTDSEPRDRDATEDMLPHSAVAGTPAYMAPELGYGSQPSAASDVYAIGVMLFEALTGKLPFSGNGYSLLLAKRDRAAHLPTELDPSVPKALRDLCMQMLEREPGARPTLEDLHTALQVGDRPSRLPRMDGSASFSIVGREPELQQLAAAYDRALSGQLTVVMLAGESGIGKTALCEQFLRRVQRDRKAVVLAGRCYERESLPFKAIDPLIDELTRYVCAQAADVQAGLMPRDAGALVQLFPVLGRVPAFAQASTRAFNDVRELQRTAFAALVELWSRLRDRGPLVLHVDDLQWTDADSVTFLRYLFIHTAAPPLLFVGSHRADAHGDKLLQRVLEAAGSNRGCALSGMELGPLSAADAERLATKLLPSHSARAAADVARESLGSPFFVGELARYAAVADSQLPQLSLGEVLRARCEPLPERAQTLLEVLALVGCPLPIDVALAAADAHHSEVDGLREARWVRVSASVSVRSLECFHDRIRETVASGLTAERTQQYYTALSRALAESTHADPELLCRFLEGAGERTAAANQALLAAEQAGEALAFEHAASLYRRALDLGDFAHERRLSLTGKLAQAFENAGHGVAAADAYEEAAALSDGDVRRDYRRRAAEQLLAMGDLARGTALMSEVFRELGMTLPLSTSAALFANLSARARLELRRGQLDVEPQRAPDAHEAMQLRAARSALTGLVGYMPLQASAITAAYLLQAMQLEDVAHRVRAEGFSAFLTSMLEPDSPRVAEYLSRIAALASRDAGPELSGFTALMHGTSAYNWNRFSDGRRHLARCLSQLRGCVGVEWEVDAAHVYDQMCALHAGHHRDIAQFTPNLIEEAFRRGRRWAGSMLSGFCGSPAWLLADDTEGYRRALALARQGWQTQERLRWPDYVLMIGEAYLSIYSGDAYPAFQLLTGARGSAASLLGGAQAGAGIKVSGNSARWFMVHQGRSAAAALADARDTSRVDTRALLKTLERCSAKLKGHSGQIWQGFAAMFQGAIAAQHGDREASLLALSRALAHLEVDGLAMHVAAARRRIGQMLGGERGRELLIAGDAFMASQTVVNVEATTELHCPGYRRMLV
ncbi:MAG TPA: AAA family ATPase [Polyangiales bacterium]|nr:AAA family ATPase [Polyangiales bacterium]